MLTLQDVRSTKVSGLEGVAGFLPKIGGIFKDLESILI